MYLIASLTMINRSFKNTICSTEFSVHSRRCFKREYKDSDGLLMEVPHISHLNKISVKIGTEAFWFHRHLRSLEEIKGYYRNMSHKEGNAKGFFFLYEEVHFKKMTL